MALFQSPTSSFLFKDPNAPQVQSTPLSSTLPSAQSCMISQMVGFPSSLASLKHGIQWNASCWVANQRLDEFEQLQIGLHAFRGQQRTPHIEWCHFATDVSGQIDMLIVFPQLTISFRDESVMQKWTDMIILPAFQKLDISAGVLSHNFNVIKMNAEAERQQTLDVNAPDTPLVATLNKRGGLSPHDMDALWTLIQETSNGIMYQGFRNLFLVARCRQPGIMTTALPFEQAWRSITATWDDAIDMNFVPLDSIRANAAVTISAHAMAQSQAQTTNGHGVSAYQSNPDSMWESSRKRKAADNSDALKRTRSDYGSSTLTPGPSPHTVEGSDMDLEM